MLLICAFCFIEYESCSVILPTAAVTTTFNESRLFHRVSQLTKMMCAGCCNILLAGACTPLIRRLLDISGQGASSYILIRG